MRQRRGQRRSTPRGGRAADLLAEDSAITLLENESLEHGRSLTQQSTQLRHALAQLSSLGDPSSLAEEVTRRLSRVSAALKKRVVDITEVVDKRRAARRELLVRLERIESEIVARARTLRESGRLDNKLSRLLDELGGGGDKRVRRNADVPPDRAPNA